MFLDMGDAAKDIQMPAAHEDGSAHGFDVQMAT